MFFSMRGRNVLRLMVDLASQDMNDLSSAKEVSKHLGLSERYLEQSFSLMKRHGFIKSERGAKGGYKLCKPASEYTVAMILSAVEESLSPVPCLEGPGYCIREEECMTVELWSRVDKAIRDVLENTTLQDLVDWHQEKIKSNR